VCFSATASFAMSGALTGLGAASIARGTSKSQGSSEVMFAAIPLLFAAQQASEGLVWLTLGDPGHAMLHRAAVRLFLTFAVVVWPSWLPLSLLLAEREPVRRRVLMLLSAWGLGVSVYASTLLARWEPAVRVVGHRLGYQYSVPSGQLLHVIGYVVPTLAPLFISTQRLARTIGIALGISLVATYVIQRQALTSVWCFFAAILSGLILAAVSRERVTATA
jgi:hypothetical protein